MIASKFGQVIGVTGNIGSGKTLVLKMLKKMGFLTFSLDGYVHSLINKNKSVIEGITHNFPECVEKGMISRKLLANKVFSNNGSMLVLERIITPYTEQKIKYLSDQVRKNRNRSIVMEVPLLFERKREIYFDKIICLYSSTNTMLKRVMNRCNMDEKKFYAIINNQLDKNEVKSQVDYLICNENRHYLLKFIKKIIKKCQI